VKEPNAMPKWKFGYQTNCWRALGRDAVGSASNKRLVYRTFAEMPQPIAQAIVVSGDTSAWTEVVL
jgi:hypothetical protein